MARHRPLIIFLFINYVSNLTTDGCVLYMYVVIYTFGATSEELQMNYSDVLTIYQWYFRNKLMVIKKKSQICKVIRLNWWPSTSVYYWKIILVGMNILYNYVGIGLITFISFAD